MNVDARLPIEDAQAPRDHRARTAASSERAADASHDAPPERTLAGGAVATSRNQNGAENFDRAKDAKKKAEASAEERRQEAERELARTMRLPNDTRLEIQVDTEKEEVKVLVRDRNTGEIVREVPTEEAQMMLQQIDQGRGTLIDRSF